MRKQLWIAFVFSAIDAAVAGLCAEHSAWSAAIGFGILAIVWPILQGFEALARTRESQRPTQEEKPTTSIILSARPIYPGVTFSSRKGRLSQAIAHPDEYGTTTPPYLN